MNQRFRAGARGRTPRAVVKAAVTFAVVSSVAVLAPPTASATQITGGAVIAYSDSADGPLGHTLMTVTSDGVIHQTGLGMMAGTSPSVAQMPDGRYWSAMQANTGQLWTVNAQQVGHPENISMAPGTSPGMGFVTPIGNPITFVQTSAGRRGGLVGSGGGDFLANDDPQTMAPGTSVGVSQEAGEAWQDSTGHLADVQISDGAMAPGTSPAYTQAQAAASIFKIVTAFQGADHDLRYVLDLQPPRPAVTTEVDTRLGMQPGTSPAVAVQPDGTFEVAFQANTHFLWVVDSHGVGHSTGLGMDPGSSPSITALPAGGFEIAFQGQHPRPVVGGPERGRSRSERRHHDGRLQPQHQCLRPAPRQHDEHCDPDAERTAGRQRTDPLLGLVPAVRHDPIRLCAVDHLPCLRIPGLLAVVREEEPLDDGMQRSQRRSRAPGRTNHHPGPAGRHLRNEGVVTARQNRRAV